MLSLLKSTINGSTTSYVGKFKQWIHYRPRNIETVLGIN